MKKLTMIVELHYYDHVHNDDEEEKQWFKEMLYGTGEDGGLILHSNEIGDEIGEIKVIGIMENIS